MGTIYNIFIYRMTDGALMQSFFMRACDVMSTSHFGPFTGDVESIWYGGVNIPVGSSAVVDEHNILVRRYGGR